MTAKREHVLGVLASWEEAGIRQERLDVYARILLALVVAVAIILLTLDPSYVATYCAPHPNGAYDCTTSTTWSLDVYGAVALLCFAGLVPLTIVLRRISNRRWDGVRLLLESAILAAAAPEAPPPPPYLAPNGAAPVPMGPPLPPPPLPLGGK